MTDATLKTGDLARLASAAYESSNDRALAKAREIDPEYELDDEFSNKYTKVFHNPKTRNTVISHRGTAEKSDIGTDALVFLGLPTFSSRFKNARTLTNKVITKYSKENVSCVGHSLGGSLCSDTSKRSDIPAVNFNKAKTLLPTSKGSKETSHKTITDPLSGSALGTPFRSAGSTFHLPKKVIGNPHSLDNFF